MARQKVRTIFAHRAGRGNSRRKFRPEALLQALSVHCPGSQVGLGNQPYNHAILGRAQLDDRHHSRGDGLTFGKLIVDAVVRATERGDLLARDEAIKFVVLEFGLVLVLNAAQRGINVCESLLRALLGQRVNELILEKALTLSLTEFEDSEFFMTE